MSTAIQWTNVTDNIIRAKQGGWWCAKISEGCTNCYAAKLNQSSFFGGNKLAYSGKPPELVLQRDIIAGWKTQTKPKKHFVASMTDVFGEWVPKEWIFEFLDGMAAAPKQTFQVLTKRSLYMKVMVIEWLLERRLERVPSNIWLGVSVENDKHYDRIADLIAIPSVHFLSCEPLLGPIDLKFWHDEDEFIPFPAHGNDKEPTNKLDWVIVGGESGPGARRCDVAWIEQIVQQCKDAKVACFVKQLGSKPVTYSGVAGAYAVFTNKGKMIDHPKGGDITEWPTNLQVREFPIIK